MTELPDKPEYFWATDRELSTKEQAVQKAKDFYNTFNKAMGNATIKVFRWRDGEIVE